MDFQEIMNRFNETKDTSKINLPLNDEDFLVRCEILEILGDFVRRLGCLPGMFEQIYLAYQKEKSKRVIIAYLALLYSIEKKRSYIAEILQNFNDNDYHIRCNVVDLICDIIDRENEEYIMQAFKERYLIEESLAVKSSIEKYILIGKGTERTS